MKTTGTRPTITLHWFRKGLRLHDNPALLEACKCLKSPITASEPAVRVYPVFCIDPYFANPGIVGVNRYNFLLESLHDLDQSLRMLGSRLYVLKGRPEVELMKAIDRWGVNKLTYEKDTEPYAKKRDHLINDLCKARNIEILSVASHTLNDLDRYIGINKGDKGLAPSYQSFQKLFLSLPAEARVRAEDEPPELIPSNGISPSDFNNPEYNVPSLEEMGYSCKDVTTSFHGGETVALQRLNDYVTTKIDYVNNFSKPNTSPNSLEPSTTVLSPYLKFGCLSPVKFYNVLMKIQASAKNPTQPPVSLLGQLLWREFFYLQSYLTVNFDKMENNPSCRQIPWERNNFVIEAWKMGRTGFPFIDAIMTQLRIEGWIHHLARHMVACFLTRGDLWQHWEEGVKVFDLFLLDSDWALNNANWQWLSCSNFFYQYFRVYSPIAFGKKTDPHGEYIRKWLPQLKSFPDQYIYEPWKAPVAVQQRCNCVIGKDYPSPIVEHDVASQQNMNRMKQAYAQSRTVNDGDEDDDHAHRKSDSAIVSGLHTSSKSKKRKETPTSSGIDQFLEKKRKP